VRIGILLLVLVLVSLAGYLNMVGLPSFLKQPLVNTLRARGVDLQFSRMRVRWYRGIVAENVHFGPAQSDANVPQVSFKEVEVRVNHTAVAHLKIKVDSLILRGGQVVWELDETNQPTETLLVTNIQSQLRLLPDDQWQLDHFTAAFAGANLHFSGSLTNASALRDWNIFRGPAAAQPERLRRHLRDLAIAIKKIKFPQPPELNIDVQGDARATETFSGLVTLYARGASTPWGEFTNGVPAANALRLPFLQIRLTAAETSNAPSKVDFKLHADKAETPWAAGRRLELNLHAAGDDRLTNLIRARLELSAASVTTRWAQTASIQLTAQWTHSLTNPLPDAGTAELRLADGQTRWGSVGEVLLNATLATPATNGPARADASWGWWAPLEPYGLEWNCHLTNLHSNDVKCPELVCGGTWRAPDLALTNLHTEIYGGRLDASASLNVATRVARFAGVSDFDVLQATPLLSTNGREWFAKQEFAWEKPPLARASGSATLPAWTNAQPNWRAEVLPTLLLQGDFKVGRGSFHHVPLDSARSHFTYSNLVWNLPDLMVNRPEGSVEIEHVSDDKTRDYYFGIHSTVDVKIVRHLLSAAGQRTLDEFVFSRPPVIDGAIWGRWHDLSRTGVKADVTIANFSYRGELATSAHGALAYTNSFLTVTNGRVERTSEYATVEGIGFDFQQKKARLTNGFSTLEPLVVAHAIGPKVTRSIEPYKFLLPPTAQVEGVIPLGDDMSVADLHFKIDGGPFEWLKFRVPHLSGQVDWVGDKMTLKEMKADFYGGKLTGAAAFNFLPGAGADFTFDTVFTGVSLGALMTDLGKGTNHLEGTLNGGLNVTKANSQDLKSWFGSGHAELRDGLIWEIPIFGVLSPLLDSIAEGWGKTRISDASAHFVIARSIIRSDNLELRSPALRLYYRGTVDFDMNVDARVEAEVGRDTPLVGPFVNLVTMPFSKIFETRVTGTLLNPKREPATWVGSGLGMLFNPIFHPWRTLKDLLPGEKQPPAPAPVYPPDKPPSP
jgi:hypothetical protein